MVDLSERDPKGTIPATEAALTALREVPPQHRIKVAFAVIRRLGEMIQNVTGNLSDKAFAWQQELSDSKAKIAALEARLATMSSNGLGARTATTGSLLDDDDWTLPRRNLSAASRPPGRPVGSTNKVPRKRAPRTRKTAPPASLPLDPTDSEAPTEPVFAAPSEG